MNLIYFIGNRMVYLPATTIQGGCSDDWTPIVIMVSIVFLAVLSFIVYRITK